MPIHAITMRTIGSRSAILFAAAAALGVIAALGLPWYGPSPAPATDTMEGLLAGIGRAFAEPSGITGWRALGTADGLIAGLAVTTAALLLASLHPAVQLSAQGLAHTTALATFALVVFKLIDEPGANAAAEPRYGLLVALGAAGVLLASSSTAAATPSRRRRPVQRYAPPPAPVAQRSEARWGPPQF